MPAWWFEGAVGLTWARQYRSIKIAGGSQASRSANPFCKAVLWKSRARGRTAFLPVLGLRQLYDGVVEFEKLSDDLRIFDAVKDGDN
jgi:hypothetical protein